MNRTKGDMRYEDAKGQVGDDADTDDGRAYLREVREWLADQYDGWGDKAGIPGRPDTETLVRELEAALEVPAIAETDAGQGLALYMEGRGQVLADAQGRGYASFDQAEEMEEGRAYLDELAAWVIERHPAFKDIYDIILSRETQVDADS